MLLLLYYNLISIGLISKPISLILFLGGRGKEKQEIAYSDGNLGVPGFYCYVTYTLTIS